MLNIRKMVVPRLTAPPVRDTLGLKIWFEIVNGC